MFYDLRNKFDKFTIILINIQNLFKLIFKRVVQLKIST